MRLFAAVALACLTSLRGFPQEPVSGSARIQLALDKLARTGSVLVIAAHPDDEDNTLLAWLSLKRKLRAGYLSLTRGEGGQNLIGPEQGYLLGVIRTEESNAAARVTDSGALFTSAVDFGYTKSSEEALRIWNHDRVLSEVVRTVREFKPDVIILRWTPRGGHGQHQASAILGEEAFHAAADPKRFPDAGAAWKTARLMVVGPGGITLDAGEFDPLLGYSYSELGGISRSMHRSQGMGAGQVRGSHTVGLRQIVGPALKSDILDGIDVREIAPMKEAARSFSPNNPAKSLPLLLRARHEALAVDPGKLYEAILLCSGLWLDASADRYSATPGETVRIRKTVIDRLGVSPNLPLNKPVVQDITWQVPAKHPFGSAQFHVPFRLTIGGEEITVEQPVHYRYIDKVLGERTRPLEIVPPLSTTFRTPTIVFATAAPKNVNVDVTTRSAAIVSLAAPQSWTLSPPAAKVEPGNTPLRFMIQPPRAEGIAEIRGASMVASIDYSHIPQRLITMMAAAHAVRVPVEVLASRIGYVMGSGDVVPDAIRQLGCEVTLFDEETLASADLARFDAIVTGVRAWTVRDDLRAHSKRLYDYVAKGGTLIVQYNTAHPLEAAPYAIKVNHDRVSVETAPVRILKPEDPLLNSPNRIGPADFAGWVQERGLYFASSWDPRYTAVIESSDPGESPLPGGMLYTRLGKGVYIFTAYSWFRQLPAGVPGAYRIFANLLSAGKTIR